MLTDEQIKALRDSGITFQAGTIRELCTRVLTAEAEAAEYKASLNATHQAHVATQARVKVLEDAARNLLKARDEWHGEIEKFMPPSEFNNHTGYWSPEESCIQTEHVAQLRKALEPSLSPLPHNQEL